jgi:uncharacterized UPF0146 family protein
MLIENIRKKTRKIIEKEEVYIKGIWSVDCLFNPNNNERVFDFKFLVVKSLGQGSAYSSRKIYDPSYLKTFMGRRINEIEFDDLAFEIAVYDSIFGKYQRNDFYAEHKLEGSSTKKALERAEIVFEECRNLLADTKKPKVVNVGVVTNVAAALRDHGYEVMGTDFDDDITNRYVYKDVYVYPGEMTNELVKEADLAVITGMTLATNSAQKILDIANQNNTRVVVFAETASNLGDFFIDAGADSFISEPFPFYIFDGTTNIRIKRKKN